MILRLPPHGHPACFALSVFAHPQTDLKIIIRPLQAALSCNLALDEHNGIRVLLNGARAAQISQRCLFGSTVPVGAAVQLHQFHDGDAGFHGQR